MDGITSLAPNVLDVLRLLQEGFFVQSVTQGGMRYLGNCLINPLLTLCSLPPPMTDCITLL